MNRIMFFDKLKVSSLHLFFSTLLISVISFIVYFVWYPFPFYQLYSVYNILLLLVIVDIILGPLLTFIVYKKGKKTLKMDLAIIFAVQIIAFLFGLKSVAESRPSWLVYYNKAVYAVSPNLIETQDGNPSFPSIFKQNWGKPKIVTVDESVLKQQKINQPPNIYIIDNYIVLDSQSLTDFTLSLNYIKKYNLEFYNKVITEYPEASGYLPVVTEASLSVPAILFDKQGEVLGMSVEDKDMIVE